MLKAHSRLFEHLTLAGDLVLIAACWVSAYLVRFHVMPAGDIPPFRDYALQLVPILVVWGFSFRAFALYRPRGSENERRQSRLLTSGPVKCCDESLRQAGTTESFMTRW